MMHQICFSTPVKLQTGVVVVVVVHNEYNSK